jgi:ribose-phosphate pyrophosphokinase
MEVLSIIDACKHAGASNITLIAPYIAYGRQNKMELPYSSIGFEILANIINNSNIDRLITVDIHEYSLLSLFNFEVTHITSSDIIKYYSQELGLEEYIMVALDLGSKKRLGSTASVYLHKKRSDNLISMELNGKVIGEKCLLIDDIIDSGRSMEAAIKCLNHHGAIDLRPYVTHFLCDKPFMIELYASDSIESNHASHRILSIVPLICRLL